MKTAEPNFGAKDFPLKLPSVSINRNNSTDEKEEKADVKPEVKDFNCPHVKYVRFSASYFILEM